MRFILRPGPAHQAFTLPGIEPGADAMSMYQVRRIDCGLIVLMRYVFSRIDVAAVIEKVYVIYGHAVKTTAWRPVCINLG